MSGSQVLSLFFVEGGAAYRRLVDLAAHRTLQVHQVLHGTAGRRDGFAIQLPPDLLGTVDLEVLVPHPLGSLASALHHAVHAAATTADPPLAPCAHSRSTGHGSCAQIGSTP